MEQVDGYGQFCPVAMAAEVICARWTPLILRELLCGSTRFNDLRRGVPRMSPTLLSKRLKELEQAGVIETRPTGQAGIVEYHLTQAGRGAAAHRHVPRHLGPALGGDAAVAEESRPVAADVGHAAQPGPDADAAAPLHDPVPLSGAAGRAANISGW